MTIKKAGVKLLCVLLIVISAGCSNTPQKERRESLSSAIEKTRNPNAEERKVSDPVVVNNNNDEYFEEQRRRDRDREREQERMREIEAQKRLDATINYTTIPVQVTTNSAVNPYQNETFGGFCMGLSSVSFGGNEIKSINSLNLSLNIHNFEKKISKDNVRDFSLFLNVGTYSLQDDFKYKLDINPSTVFGGGIKLGNSLFDINENVSFNWIVGLGIQAIYWDYKKPLHDSYTEIRGDGIAMCRIQTGFGIIYRRPKDIYMKVEFLPEIMLPGGATTQGFSNDVFSQHFGIGLVGEIGGL